MLPLCCFHSLPNLQGSPGLSEGQTEDNESLRVKLGRLLCQLGKQGLVVPGGLPNMSISAMAFSKLSLYIMTRQLQPRHPVENLLAWLSFWGLQGSR